MDRKGLLFFAVSVTMLLLVAVIDVHAFKGEDVARVRETNECGGCDLSAADIKNSVLIGANSGWREFDQCKAGPGRNLPRQICPRESGQRNPNPARGTARI